MNLGNGLGHLTYSTLVHPGDTWDEMWSSLTTYVPQVKARVAPDEPFGVSLRLSAASARTLAEDGARRDELRSFLDGNDLYLYTVNAFPYGPFKGRVVKEDVYEPDWRSEERRTRLFGTCKFQPVKGDAEVWQAETFDTGRAALEAFAAAAGGGQAFPIRPDEMVHGAAVTEAIVRSAASGAPERVA